MKKVLFILGPTGVGKSELGIKLAQKFNGEIISADSVQVFRGLDIGSAKISAREQALVKHHAIDILPPEAKFSVFEYVKLTKQLIDEIIARGKRPIIVGGTGLYVKALTLGYDFGGEGEDPKLRESLESLSEEELLARLKNLDPKRAEQIDSQNKRRLVRAVELAMQGKSVGSTQSEIDYLILALSMPRDQLYERINKRVDQMMQNGLVEEVKSLKAKGLTKFHQSMSAIGYKEILSYLDGEIDLEEAVRLIKQHSRNYAKRQQTFLRGLDCKIVSRDDEAGIEKFVEEFYEN